MTDLVPAADIERIVGAKRHPTKHIARAVNAETTVYILHSRECLGSGIDLRECEFSLALDNGIVPIWTLWKLVCDVPVVVDVQTDPNGEAWLVPVPGVLA